MIRAFIVDDDAKGRDFLSNTLKAFYKDVEVCGVAADVDSGLQSIYQSHPNLVFLDVEMPGKNGFDLLNEIKEIRFEVIFITGHDEYALKAFRFNAIDYLLKPIDLDELETAINKVRKRISDPLAFNSINFLELIANLKNADNRFDKLGIPTQDGLIFVRLDEIVSCEAQSNYTLFYLTNKQKIISSKTLGEYEDLLNEYGFFRVHKSHLINLEHIKRYIRGDGGTVVLSNDQEIDVSRQKKEEFLKRVRKLPSGRP